MKQFLLAFVPIFVAVDAIGVMPIFLSLTHGLSHKKIKKVVLESVLTAVSAAIFFIFLGKAIFRLLGITIGDFMVAGGMVLFCIAIVDLVTSGKKRRVPGPNGEIGAVPIGMPLIVGPAVLTTSLLLADQFGIFVTSISVIVNVIFAGFLFSFSKRISSFLGTAGANALSKIMMLLLSSIAVMMIRKGFVLLLSM